jgi:Cu(I)/Ag(I) efflux system membrane protein CusA/SilA
MPASLPGMSITKAAELMQTQNKIIKSFPEVASVYGKAGRANTATDPAPTEMFETVINLKPESEWRPGMTTDKLIAELDKAMQFPASPTPGPCRSRRVSTCCPPAFARRSASRSSARISAKWRSWPREIEAVVKAVPGTTSAFAERITGGFYINIKPDREQLARYGLAVGDLQDVIGTALGGEMVTTTVEGRERFGVTVRYPRELRSDPQQIAREVLVPTMAGAMIPLGQLAKVEVVQGRTVDPHRERAAFRLHLRRHPRSRHRRLRRRREEGRGGKVKFPPGYYVTWSGQFEYMERAIEKMKIVIPVTLLSIFLLLYLNFKRLTETFIVMLSVPFALVGGVWLMWLLNYNLSVAVAVGFIALAGVAAETGVVMLIYLDHAWEAEKEEVGAGGTAAGREDSMRP